MTDLEFLKGLLKILEAQSSDNVKLIQLVLRELDKQGGDVNENRKA